MCRTCVASRELGVYIDGFVLTTGLHRALTIGIIPIVAHKTILIDCQQAILLVPLELLLTYLVILFAITLYTRSVDVDKIAVGIVLVLVTIVDGRAVRWHFLRAVIDVTHIVKLELLTLFATMGVGEFIAGTRLYLHKGFI